VWEVGPGLGVLTRALAAAAQRVVTVELDARLLSVLDETLADAHNVAVRHGDALRVDWTEARAGSRFAANLPYNVGTAVLVKALTSGRFARLGVLLQREVAERLVAAAGTSAYGSLSLLIAHHGRARITRRVAAGAFMPPPAVTSAVVTIDVDPDARPDPTTFALVRAGFRHRRKTLLSNLRLAGLEADVVRAALADLGLPPAVRAEALDLATFRALALRVPTPAVPDGMST
jgi:16S rRNA (adenine1518-N6/adenine1519-N6)-dimethyltransferase